MTSICSDFFSTYLSVHPNSLIVWRSGHTNSGHFRHAISTSKFCPILWIDHDPWNCCQYSSFDGFCVDGGPTRIWKRARPFDTRLYVWTIITTHINLPTNSSFHGHRSSGFNYIQGLPSQSGSCNSSILAYLNDNFLHKTFAKFILHTFCCIVLHKDIFRAIWKKKEFLP